MKRLFSYCRPYGFFLAITLVIKVFATLLDLLIPYLLGFILDEVAPTCSQDRLWPIFLWGGLMMLCAAGTYFTNLWANRRSSYFAKEVIQKIRQDLFEKILSISAAQTDRFTVPSLVSRMSSDSYTLHSMLVQLFRAGVRAPILLIGGVVITLISDPILALSMIAILPFMLIIVTKISKRGIILYKEKQKKVDRMVEKVRDTFTGIRVIKALSKVEYEKEHFETISNDLSKGEEKAGITVSVSNPVVTLCLNLGMTAVVVLGAWRVHGGSAAPGQIISFMSYFTMILNATLVITRVFTQLSQGIASADRINEVFEAPKELETVSLAAEEDAPYLEFRNVSFSYHKTIPTVDQISFSLKKGQTLGIIGSTGSGKTTLIQLLMRFYDPDQGQILLEGRDVRSIPKEELRQKFGVVFQNDFLFADTITENIRFARKIEEEDIKNAAETAQAIPFIEEKEGGFDHLLVVKGANLSGGQRQRLLLARAVADHPEILILDDSSSALDYKTDAELRVALRKNLKDSTQIIVAQRISSIRHADLILVLEHGTVIGMGTDETLSQNCPVYQEIANSQMGEMMV